MEIAYNVLTIISMISSLFILVFLSKKSGLNITFFKKNCSIIIIFMIIVSIILILINNVINVKNIEGVSILVNEYVIFLFACGVSTLIMIPITISIQKIKERKIIKASESQFKVNEYIYYRDLVGDVPSAFIYELYGNNKNIDDLIVASYLYMLQKNIITVKNGIILGTDKKLEYEFEKVLMKYFNGAINKEDLKKEIKKAIKIDMQHEGFLCNSSNTVSIAEAAQMIGLWIFFSLLMFMYTVGRVGNIGVLLFISYAISLASMLIYDVYNNRIIEYKSEKSLLIISKLNGLYSFFKNFNIMSEKQVNDIKLYDDYILYAIIFNIKGKLNKDVKKMYKNIAQYRYNTKINNGYQIDNKIIDLDEDQWKGFIGGFAMALIFPCIIYLDPNAREAPYMWLFWLMPASIILFALIASHKNKRKKR